MPSRKKKDSNGTQNWDGWIQQLNQTKDVKNAAKAAKAIGKLATYKHVAQLYDLLKSSNQLIREAVAKPLAKLDGIKALRLLFEAMRHAENLGQDNDGIIDSVLFIVESNKKKSVPYLLSLLEDKNPKIRLDAVWALGYASTEVKPEMFFNIIHQDPDEEVRMMAADSIHIYVGKAKSPLYTKAFSGRWMWNDCDEHLRFGFDIQGTQGICIKNNASTFSVGEVMLRIALGSGYVFVGEQIFVNGCWYPVTGVIQDNKLTMRGGGLIWIMERE